MSVIERSGCAVLAGGAGKRMGQVNKAELGFNGRPFLARICSEADKVGIKGYLSVANYEQNAPESWTLVEDSVTSADGGFVGPMGGVLSCLQQAEADGLEGMFFVPCDAPLYTSAVHEKLAGFIDDDTDAVCWKTADGRIQTTFGWYSVRCLPAIREDALNGKYKLIKTLEKVRFKTVRTEAAGIDDRAFMNINEPGDYHELTETRKKHILICGKKQVGKTTLVNKIIKVMEDAGRPVYGFRTKASEANKDGIRHIYMYPVRDPSEFDDEEDITTDNHVGDTCGKVLDVNTEVFDQLGVSLIRGADKDGILVMDELGFMEENANDFRSAVMAALDGDIPVLATVKDTDKNSGFLDEVKNHPRAELLMIDEENREDLYRYVKDAVMEW